MIAATGSLFAAVPDKPSAEWFETLLEMTNVRIERIVSTGQATPPGEWLEQGWDEWVLLVSGAAEILLQEEDAARRLEPGDYLFIPASVCHRVTWTPPNQPTVWLAVHIDVR